MSVIYQKDQRQFPQESPEETNAGFLADILVDFNN